ncbi:MAG: hypothetical protein AMR96_06815 [Candidatus Adiutrix intracellularis]|jgi:hypothetical protein|nr:MAG: hypothetical protein AMR96_06815 [Candidatus Adiutrix intracellularis]
MNEAGVVDAAKSKQNSCSKVFSYGNLLRILRSIVIDYTVEVKSALEDVKYKSRIVIQYDWYY